MDSEGDSDEEPEHVHASTITAAIKLPAQLSFFESPSSVPRGSAATRTQPAQPGGTKSAVKPATSAGSTHTTSVKASLKRSIAAVTSPMATAASKSESDPDDDLHDQAQLKL